MLPRIHVSVTLLSLSCLSGCAGLFSSRGLPDDPLFVNRKPLESKAVSAPPIHVAHVEPAPPPNPYFAANRAVPAPARLTPGVLTGRPAGAPRQDDSDE
jgi:hypothetical protein